jgi:hypothetical protein
MFDPKTLTIARHTIDAARFAQHTRFEDEVSRVENAFASCAASHSGARVQAVADVCATEIETRAIGVWANLHRALVATGVRSSPELASELKTVFNDLFMTYCCEEPERKFNAVRESLGGVAIAGRAATGFEGRVYGARRRIEAEIDLFVRSL